MEGWISRRPHRASLEAILLTAIHAEQTLYRWDAQPSAVDFLHHLNLRWGRKSLTQKGLKKLSMDCRVKYEIHSIYKEIYFWRCWKFWEQRNQRSSLYYHDHVVFWSITTDVQSCSHKCKVIERLNCKLPYHQLTHTRDLCTGDLSYHASVHRFANFSWRMA